MADVHLYYGLQMGLPRLVRGTSGSRLDTGLKRARRNRSLATSLPWLVGCMCSTVELWTATPSEARSAAIHRLFSGHNGGGREGSLRSQRSKRGDTGLSTCRCNL
jgi:hypothetical protein